MNWIEFRDVTLGYGRQPVLERLNFGLPTGEAVGLAGPNGSGKTTILKAILGLLRPARGEIARNGGWKHSIGYVPQRGAIDEGFPFTLGEIVEMGIYGCLSPFGRPDPSQREAIARALSAVGLLEMLDRQFRELSGGQKQRALLARALVHDPRVLILDEPTYGLDVAQAQALLELLETLRRDQGISLVAVSHDLPQLLECSQRILLLHQGRMAFAGPVGELTDALLSGIYGVSLHLHEHFQGAGRRPGIIQEPVGRVPLDADSRKGTGDA